MLRPTARTTPLTSLPRMAGNFSGKSFCRAPDRIFQSTGFTLVAEVSTSTESESNVGSGASSSYFRFSGPPYSYNRTAFTSSSKTFMACTVCRSTDRPLLPTEECVDVVRAPGVHRDEPLVVADRAGHQGCTPVAHRQLLDKIQMMTFTPRQRGLLNLPRYRSTPHSSY